MIHKWIFLLSALFLFSLSSPAHADNCSTSGTPVTLGACSSSGARDWDTTNSLYKYCNGTNWVSMKGTSAGSQGSCAGFKTGELEGVVTSWGALTYQFCDGTDWFIVANNGSLGSCAGFKSWETEYDTSNNLMKYCDGTNWIDMTETAVETGKCVFVTSGTSDADLGGSGGADSICDTHAGNASLGGTYQAWIAWGGTTPPSGSDDCPGAGGCPAERNSQSITPYITTAGLKLADDWNDLITSGWIASVDVDESGVAVADRSAWSRSNDGGGRNNSADRDCGNWRDAFPATWGYCLGGSGLSCSGGSKTCDTTTLRLLCVEQ